MAANKVICVISNYDKDKEAQKILAQLDCEAYVVDSSGKEKSKFCPTDAPFFSGCFNKACEIFLQSDATHCLFVCSDIQGHIQEVVTRIEQLPKNIGIYSPSVSGQGWLHQKPKGSGLRDVPFCEGMIYCTTKSVIKQVHPVDAQKNPHWFGVDIYMAYVASEIFGKRVVIDDDINVFHPYGTSYDAQQGQRDMIPYVISKGAFFVEWFKQHILSLPYS